MTDLVLFGRTDWLQQFFAVLFFVEMVMGIVAWGGWIHRPKTWVFRVLGFSMAGIGAAQIINSAFSAGIEEAPLKDNPTWLQACLMIFSGRAGTCLLYLYYSCVLSMWSEALRILQVSAQGSSRQVRLMFWLTGLNAVAFVATAVAMVWTELPYTSEFDQIKDMVLYLAFLVTFVFHAWKLCTALARISQVNSALIEDGAVQGLPCRCCAVVCGIEWGFIAASICCRTYSAPMHSSLQGIIVRKADAKFVRIAFVAILVATGVCVRVVKSALECFTLYTEKAVLPWNPYNAGVTSGWMIYTFVGVILPLASVWLLTLDSGVVSKLCGCCRRCQASTRRTLCCCCCCCCATGEEGSGGRRRRSTRRGGGGGGGGSLSSLDGASDDGTGDARFNAIMRSADRSDSSLLDGGGEATSDRYDDTGLATGSVGGGGGLGSAGGVTAGLPKAHRGGGGGGGRQYDRAAARAAAAGDGYHFDYIATMAAQHHHGGGGAVYYASGGGGGGGTGSMGGVSLPAVNGQYPGFVASGGGGGGVAYPQTGQGSGAGPSSYGRGGGVGGSGAVGVPAAAYAAVAVPTVGSHGTRPGSMRVPSLPAATMVGGGPSSQGGYAQPAVVVGGGGGGARGMLVRDTSQELVAGYDLLRDMY